MANDNRSEQVSLIEDQSKQAQWLAMEIDKVDQAHQETAQELKTAIVRLGDEMAALRKTLTSILITIVSGMVVALAMWAWTNAAAG